MADNIRLYPWFAFLRNLPFWQAVWFLYFQNELSAAEAILLYAVYDISTTALEVPSGYLSDRVGRRITLLLSTVAAAAGPLLIAFGDSFLVFALGQILLGAGAALASGTDSALLYESLDREGRADEIERHELTAWRASFAGLAFSALAGGLIASLDIAAAFAASALTGCITVAVAYRFREPGDGPEAHGRHDTQITLTLRALAIPVLLWLFVLQVLMYAFSHVPFVFGQPFIQTALDGVGLGSDAPIVSGAVTTAMMLVSLGSSWLAPALRRIAGLGALLLIAFGIQILLTGAMAVSNDVVIIAVLMLRMVPDSLSKPFILARIQPLLEDRGRATYLSMQSFCGRLLLALTLIWASGDVSDHGALSYAEMQQILGWYMGVGIVLLAGLAIMARRARVNG